MRHQREKDTDRKGKRQCDHRGKKKKKWLGCGHKPRKADSHQQLGDKKSVLLKPQKECSLANDSISESKNYKEEISGVKLLGFIFTTFKLTLIKVPFALHYSEQSEKMKSTGVSEASFMSQGV